MTQSVSSQSDTDHSHAATPQWSQRYQQSLMNNYGTPQVEFVSGSGSHLTDSEGRDYIDFLSGIAVNSLGQAHPDVTAAVSQQLSTLGHVSNFYAHEPGLRLAERLIEKFHAGEDSDEADSTSTRVAFSNSGAEANEMAFKIARLTGRRRILSAVDGFHGRTMGALALTGQPAKRDMFAPLPGGVEYFPYNDADYLEQLIAVQPDAVAAVIFEPIQGETGVVPATDEFLGQARALTRECGALLICDEVQTGNGRTGDYFAFQHAGIVPDVVTTAKGLAAGLPIGATIATGEAARLLTPGSHGSTFAGNPIVCAAANVVLDHLDGELMENVAARSTQAWDELVALPGVDHVRGRGLMLGIVRQQSDAKEISAAALKQGLLINAPAPNVLRFIPPLNLTAEDLSAGIERLRAAIADVAG